MIGRPNMFAPARWRISLKFAVTGMDVFSGITAGVLRLGIAQGGYTAYVEVADSGVGSQAQ
jgi:hypothetical protein